MLSACKCSYACFKFVGREDLAKQLSNDTDDKLSMSNPAKKDLGTQTKNNKEEDDGINSLDYEVCCVQDGSLFNFMDQIDNRKSALMFQQ